MTAPKPSDGDHWGAWRRETPDEPENDHLTQTVREATRDRKEVT